MSLAITFAPASGSNYVLSDGSATAAVRSTRVTLARQVQVSQGLRWTTAKVFARQNQTVSISFQVQRLHATEADATNYVLTHSLSGVILPSATGTLQFNVGGGSFQGKLVNAVCQNATSYQLGATSFNDYVFVGTDAVSGS